MRCASHELPGAHHARRRGGRGAGGGRRVGGRVRRRPRSAARLGRRRPPRHGSPDRPVAAARARPVHGAAAWPGKLRRLPAARHRRRPGLPAARLDREAPRRGRRARRRQRPLPRVPRRRAGRRGSRPPDRDAVLRRGRGAGVASADGGRPLARPDQAVPAPDRGRRGRGRRRARLRGLARGARPGDEAHASRPSTSPRRAISPSGSRARARTSSAGSPPASTACSPHSRT